MPAHRPHRYTVFALASAVCLVAIRPPLSFATSEDAALTSAWTVALAVSAWIAVVSAVASVAIRRRHIALARLTSALAPGFMRRGIEVALVASLSVGAMTSAGAAETSGPVAVVRDSPVVRALAEPATTTTTTTTVPTTATTQPIGPSAPVTTAAPPPSIATPPPPAPAPTAAPLPTDATHTVQPGDNLWRIARATLVARGESSPTDAAIAQYWHTVIAANRATLRSGNPALIFPGEIVALPDPA